MSLRTPTLMTKPRPRKSGQSALSSTLGSSSAKTRSTKSRRSGTRSWKTPPMTEKTIPMRSALVLTATMTMTCPTKTPSTSSLRSLTPTASADPRSNPARATKHHKTCRRRRTASSLSPRTITTRCTTWARMRNSPKTISGANPKCTTFLSF